MYFKLALGNVRKSARDYSVYFITLALGVAVFYAFNTIGMQADFLNGDVANVLEFVGQAMQGITVFLALILGFLMVYANNFLVRRRKRELSLYQILGMTRGKVSAVLTFETLIASIGSFVVGLVMGVLLSQLLVFVTAALFNDTVQEFRFMFSVGAALFTLACFSVIFIIMLIFNLRNLRKVNLAELMRAERQNEKIKVRSLPATLVLGIGGVALIAWAYMRLTRDGLPVSSTEEYANFLVTTLIVTVGTLVFFFALSGVLLHLGMLNRKHYYRGINMFTLRQVSSRFNTVSLSMGVITLIVFLAITISASGFAMCSIFQTNRELATPYDATITAYYLGEDIPGNRIDIKEELAKSGFDIDSIAKDSVQIDSYNPYSVADTSDLTYAQIADAAGINMPDMVAKSENYGNGIFLDLMSQTDYNKVLATAGLKPVDLHDSSYLVTMNSNQVGAAFMQEVLDHNATLTIDNTRLTPAQTSIIAPDFLKPHSAQKMGASEFVDSNASIRTMSLQTSLFASNSGTLIVPDSVLKNATISSSKLNLDYAGNPQAAEDALKNFAKNSKPIGEQEGQDYGLLELYTKVEAQNEAAGMSGILAYLAIYIGFILIVGSAAILAIQQLSSASDAAPNYRVLAEIGVSRAMAARSLRTQILLIFTFPFLLALAHSAVALNQVTKVVSLIGAGNISGYVAAAIAIFIAVYVIYFVVTYNTAKRIAFARTHLRRE